MRAAPSMQTNSLTLQIPPAGVCSVGASPPRPAC